ncbi:hypothetical protein CCYA_CCYA10G2825 [Cyanidiococcus yangmingshanensis]|nr:hypothetical protein CCYA_CCYA10G2825 [Cyanidiococcus yangmingshanensis]
MPPPPSRLRVPSAPAQSAQGPNGTTVLYTDTRFHTEPLSSQAVGGMHAGDVAGMMNAGAGWQPTTGSGVGTPAGTSFVPLSVSSQGNSLGQVRLRSDSSGSLTQRTNIYGQQYWTHMLGSGQAFTSMVSQFARVAWLNVSGASPTSHTGTGAHPDMTNSVHSLTFCGIPKAYFQVDVSYVLRKLWILFFPFRHRSWSRKRKLLDPFANPIDADSVSQAAGQRLLPPSEDLNAPDLYIPVMSFVTYVLLIGLLRGTEGKFTPQVMGEWASMGLITVVLEVLLIRVSLFLAQSPRVVWVDLVAYSGYKFVGLAFSTTCALLASFLPSGRIYVSLAVLLYVSLMMGLFLLRSFRRLIRSDTQSGDVSMPSSFDTHVWDAQHARRNYVLLFIALLQIPIYLLLGVRTWARLGPSN